MDNQVLDVIKARRAIRAYKEDSLTKEQIHTLLEAALHSPSALNQRTWHIIAVTDKELLKQLDIDLVELLLSLNVPALTERIRSRGNSMIYNAPALFLITAKKSHGYEAFDAGVMAQTFTLAAKSIGLDSVIIAVLEKLFASEKGKHYIDKMKFPPEHEFLLSVAVGHANHEAPARELSFDDKVTHI